MDALFAERSRLCRNHHHREQTTVPTPSRLHLMHSLPVCRRRR